MGSVGYPDRCQLAGTVQLGQHRRIAAIGLDAVSSLHRDQRRCGHDAAVPASSQQTVKPIPARTCFIAKAETTAILAEPSNHPAQNLGAVLKHPSLPHLE